MPKASKWNSLVYLHGRLGTDRENDALVFTSGDFGTAYLTEQWAARFVVELFGRFNVAFVGYSANDPVMRYVLDALAAERAREGSRFSTFAFAGAKPEKRDEMERGWRIKGVEPVMYDDQANHHLLLASLQQWATLWRGGLGSRRSVALDLGKIRPDGLPPESRDQFLWALSHEAGLRAFCSLGSAAAIEWIGEFPQVSLSLNGEAPAPVDPCGRQESSHAGSAIASWMAEHHLENPWLLEYVLKRGGRLAPSFRKAVRRQLAMRHPLPRGVSDLWHLLQSARDEEEDIYAPLPDGSAPDACAQLLALLEPRLRWSAMPAGVRTELGIKTSLTSAFASMHVDLRISNRSDELLTHFSKWDPEHKAAAAVPISNRLLDIIYLLKATGYTGENTDVTLTLRPSISPSEHNRSYARRDWLFLIDLVRDAYAALDSADSDQARALARLWLASPFPIFRRLGLHAAATGTKWTTEERLRILLGDE